MFAQLSNPSAEDAVSNKGKPETRLRLDDEKLWGYSQTQLHRVIYLSVASSCHKQTSQQYMIIRVQLSLSPKLTCLSSINIEDKAAVLRQYS